MSPYKLLADALDDVAARLADAVAELRDLEVADEDRGAEERRKTAARERMQRYRARRTVTRNRVTGDASPRNVETSKIPETRGPVTTDSSKEEVGVTDERAESDASPRNGVTRNRVTDRDARDDQPASPWRAEPEPDDLTRTDEDRERLASTLAAIRAEHGMKGKP